MSSATEEPSNLFGFMVVRHPKTVSERASRRNYIFDDRIANREHIPADLFSEESYSTIGRLVYEKVFCPEPEQPPAGTTGVPASSVTSQPTLRTKNLAVVEAAMGLLTPYYAPCPHAGPVTPTATPIEVETLAGRNHFELNGLIYLLPERLSDISLSWATQLPKAFALIRNAGNATEIRALAPMLAKLFDTGKLYHAIFDYLGHQSDYLANKRVLFDNLYLLYVLRRAFDISLEETIDGLRTLRIIELLAVDELIAELRENSGTNSDNSGIYTVVQLRYPELRGWDFKATVPGIPLIPSRTRLRELLAAAPVVHPLFARLHGYRTPFNSIKPIGIGDLKVVKQTSLGYVAGDIAHIDNILKNETKTRTHRRLEKSEDTFSFSSEDRSEIQRDTQSSERFELKRETDSTLNAVLNVNANASVTYNNMPVVATVSGGVAYTSTSNDVEKTASNFARDIVDKAVRRVESRVSQQRSSSRLLETEETNVHSFDNKGGAGHVSGIYRWVDRRYRSQTYNFGKRLMFEFVIPEPAAFFVESRLLAFESLLDVPQPPQLPASATLPAEIVALRPEHIDEAMFRSLQLKYDLSDTAYPEQRKFIDIIDQATGRNYFSANGINNSTWDTRTFTSRIDAGKYRMSNIWMSGFVLFQDKRSGGEDEGDPREINTFEFRLNGQQIFRRENNEAIWWPYNQESHPLPGSPPITGDTLTLFFGFWDALRFEFSLHAELVMDGAALYEWQSNVYRKVVLIEQAKIDALNEQYRQIHAAETARYKARLSEVKAAAVSDLLRGQSSAANRQLVIDELKKHCISMIAKEFDADGRDDTLSKLQAIGTRNISIAMRPFRINESPTATTAGYTTVSRTVPLPSIDLDVARTKGRYVQFLEQAFDWQQLAYLLYPYFWALPERWVDTMSRMDPADPQFTAFLQAGSARVLVAATPAYEDAVMHFIATGEPWDGGPSPVIGDPLFLPIHEELRRQQDDLYGGTADGAPWEFTLPTALIYLENSSTPLPGPPAPPPSP